MACALVTGASGGIGEATALLLAQNSWAVALGCCINTAKAEALREEIVAAGGKAIVCRADVAVEAQVEQMFRQAEAALGPVGLLVNNAGHAQQKQFQDITAAEWDAMMNVHARGAFLCAKRALPAMLHAHEGSIVNIASVWGQVGASCEVHYSAAKAALIGMTKALAKEVAPSGVRVNCVAPGAVETAMLSGFSAQERQQLAADIPLGRLGSPMEVAGAVLYLANAHYVTGQVLSVDGGWA